MENYDKIIQESKRVALSRGLFGNTYLVEDGKYVIKTQRLPLTSARKKTGKFWQELRIYDWIDKLTPIVYREFFCTLLTWRTIQPCELPKRETKLLATTRKAEVRKLNTTPLCVELLLENKGIPFDDWLSRNMPDTKSLVYSLLGQLAAIHIIMFQEGGYHHNDLHFENVLVNVHAKNPKPINIHWNGGVDCKVSFVNGVQLVAIDYGEATKVRQGKRAKMRLVQDMVESILDLLMKRYKYKHGTDVVVEKQDLNVDLVNDDNEGTVFVFPKRVINGVDKVIKQFPEVFQQARASAVSIDPAFDSIFQQILERKRVHSPGAAASVIERRAVRRIQQELQLAHPKAFGKIFKDVEFHKATLLSSEVVRAFLDCRNVSSVLKLISSKQN
jgi:hypothetical protein